MAETAAVALNEVVVAFRVARGGTFTAVDRATLRVADGEFVAIVGPTGCGKSTLLNIAAGLLTPYAGSAEIFGAPLAGLNTQAGYLFQADALFPWKTALDNVAIGLEIAGTSPADAKPRAHEPVVDPRHDQPEDDHEANDDEDSDERGHDTTPSLAVRTDCTTPVRAISATSGQGMSGKPPVVVGSTWF